MKSVIIFVLVSCSFAFGGLVNGNAETGDFGGWQNVDDNIIYTVRSQKEKAGTVIPAEGEFFFAYCKSAASSAEMSQTGLIAEGISMLTMGGLFQGEYTDYGVATLSIFDEAGVELATASRSNITSDNGQWVPFQVIAVLPQNSYSWEVKLEGFLDYGSMINVFYDDIYLIPEPASLLLLGLGGLALRRRKC